MTDSKAKKGLIFTGHSHILALGVPPNLPKESKKKISVERLFGGELEFYATLEDKWDVNRKDSYWEHTAKHSQGRPVAIFWQGNQYNCDFLFKQGRQFDLIVNNAATTTTIPGAQLVPVSVVRAYLEPAFGGLVKAIEILKSGGVKKIYVIETPPPKGDAEYLVPYLTKSDLFRKLADISGLKITPESINPASVRQKLWRETQNISLDVAKKCGATYIPIPPDVMEPDGTLKSQYWAKDVTHANISYGSRIRSYLTELSNKGVI